LRLRGGAAGSIIRFSSEVRTLLTEFLLACYHAEKRQ
jgi:hypothetical protein